MDDTFTSGDIAAVAETPSASPSGETSPVSTPAAPSPVASPIASPAAAVPGDTPVTGTPPPERWPDILDNARKKTREEVEANYQWAAGVDRAEFEAARQWLDLTSRDPILGLDRYMQRLASQPDLQPQLRSYAARILGTRTAAAPVDQMPGPDIPTSESNGEPVVYSAQQMQRLLEWKDRQTKALLEQELGPIKQDREKAQAKVYADAYADATVPRLEKLPGFKEHVAAIRDAYMAIPVNDPRTEGEKLKDAYLDVVGPQLTSEATRQAVTDLQRKASASTVNPAATSTSTPFDFKKESWEAGLKHVWNQKAGSR